MAGKFQQNTKLDVSFCCVHVPNPFGVSFFCFSRAFPLPLVRSSQEEDALSDSVASDAVTAPVASSPLAALCLRGAGYFKKTAAEAESQVLFCKTVIQAVLFYSLSDG
ncbi:hypothetical protein JTE90_024365 [Oedothorax gibbosus]|uniref:Uncharacterized protein n=1 Tax=Oedothorax gibbosus TaxID=931172 RepID=A0AAV6W162_9ARAC|nr:hypothetical protein JTE90_024365 [Oedothorax gibbosus]